VPTQVWLLTPPRTLLQVRSRMTTRLLLPAQLAEPLPREVLPMREPMPLSTLAAVPMRVSEQSGASVLALPQIALVLSQVLLAPRVRMPRRAPVMLPPRMLLQVRVGLSSQALTRAQLSRQMTVPVPR
jgi:hypothetical protein